MNSLDKMEDYDRLKQERDELAAQVGVMHAFILKVSQQKPEKPDHWNSCGQCERNENEAEELLETTPSAALREIEARTLEEAADNAPCDASERYCRTLAAAKRKGE